MREFAKLCDNIVTAVDNLPQQIATLAVNFSKERFVEQSWLDSTKKTWQKRKRARRGGKARQRGAVLVDSGRLKRSIRKISVTPHRIVIGTDVPYAAKHNFGHKGIERVKSHGRRSVKGKRYVVGAFSRRVDTPQRQFMGESATLNKRIELLCTTELSKAIKSALK